jgi:hypothetical protein
MRPRLQALVAEQLRTVQQQIAEFHVLERQLAQVLQRLQSAPPASHADGCQCLGSVTPPTQEPHPVPIPRKGTAMSTSTLEPLTLLAPASRSDIASSGDQPCGCGCGCDEFLMQVTLPQEARKNPGDHHSAQPTEA